MARQTFAFTRLPAQVISTLLMGLLLWTPVQAVMASHQRDAVPVSQPDQLGWNFVMQQRDAGSCGPAVLAMILQRTQNNKIELSTVKPAAALDSPTDQRGLERLARRFGIRGTWQDNLDIRSGEAFPTPAIAVLSTGGAPHFVLVERSVDNYVLLSDPLTGRLIFPWTSFQDAWTGQVFTLEGIAWPRT